MRFEKLPFKLTDIITFKDTAEVYKTITGICTDNLFEVTYYHLLYQAVIKGDVVIKDGKRQVVFYISGDKMEQMKKIYGTTLCDSFTLGQFVEAYNFYAQYANELLELYDIYYNESRKLEGVSHE
jgi:hypothetical protein